MSAIVTANIITPSYPPMWEYMALNATENMIAPFCAPCSTNHSYPICSYAVKSGVKVWKKYLNADVDANAFFKMFDCIYFRKCPCVMGLQVQCPVPDLIPRVVTLTTRRTLFDGVNTPSCPTSWQLPLDQRQCSRCQVILDEAPIAVDIQLDVTRRSWCISWQCLWPMTKMAVA